MAIMGPWRQIRPVFSGDLLSHSGVNGSACQKFLPAFLNAFLHVTRILDDGMESHFCA